MSLHACTAIGLDASGPLRPAPACKRHRYLPAQSRVQRQLTPDLESRGGRQLGRRAFIAVGGGVLALSLGLEPPASAMSDSLANSALQAATQLYFKDYGPGGTTPGKELAEQKEEQAKIVDLGNGLRYKDVRVGEGPPLGTGDVIVCHVMGQTRSGGIFVDTRTVGQPLTFTYGILPDGVTEGLEDGVRGMSPGGRRIIDIPAELAYGNALGPVKFDVEVLRCTRLESGELTCCLNKDYPCDAATNPKVITLFGKKDEPMPNNAAFRELNSFLKSPEDMLILD